MTPDGNPTFDPSQPFQTVGAQPAAPAASGAPAFDASKPFDVVPTPRQYLQSLGATEGPQTQPQPLPAPEVTPQAVIAATSPQAEAPKPEPVAPFAGERGHMETPQAAEAPVTGDDVRAAMRGMPPELQMSPAGYGGEEPLATIGREAFNAATTPGPSVTALKAEIFRPRTPEEVQEALDLAEAGKYSPDAAAAALSIKSIAKDAGLAVGSVLDAVGGAFNGAAAGAQQALMSAGLPEEKAGALVEAAQLIGMDVGAAMPTVPPVGSRYLPKPIAPEDMEILRGTAGQRPRPGGLPQPPEPIEGTATSVPEPPPQGPAPGGAPAATPAPGRPGRATRPIAPMPEITTIQELEDELDRTDGAGTRDKPMDIRSPGDLAVASQNVNTEPSGAQVEAGNYKKGHGTFQGLPVTIETPAGAERRGVGPDGQPWSVMLQHPYGYVKGTVGADGEHVDTYVGPHADSPTAFVVDQVDPSTGQFDEHKTVLGANTQAEAAQIYDAGFSDGSGPSRRAAITAMPMDEFKSWLKTGDTTAPAAPPPATARQLHDDILSGAVAPRAADVAKRYRIDPTQAAHLLDQVSQRPDPAIELAGGKEAAQRPGGQYDPTAYTWRRIPDDRRESTLAGLNQWSDRMFGVSRRNFASDADFADAVAAARDRHQEVLARANELDIRPNQNATTEEVQAQIAEREAMMMEGEGHEQIDAHADGTERDIDAAVPHSLPETSDDIPGFGEPRGRNTGASSKTRAAGYWSSSGRRRTRACRRSGSGRRRRCSECKSWP